MKDPNEVIPARMGSSNRGGEPTSPVRRVGGGYDSPELDNHYKRSSGNWGSPDKNSSFASRDPYASSSKRSVTPVVDYARPKPSAQTYNAMDS